MIKPRRNMYLSFFKSMSKNTVFVKLKQTRAPLKGFGKWETRLISLKGHQDLNVTRKDYQNPLKTRQEGHQNPFKIYQVFKRRLRSALSNSLLLDWGLYFHKTLRRPDAF